MTRTFLEKADKVPAPDNIKASLDTQIEKIKNVSINIKSQTVDYENFFLYDNENMMSELCISELSRIAFLGKTNNKSNKLHQITPKHKLKFSQKKVVCKNKIELKLGNVHTKTSFSTPRDNVLNVSILCTKRNKTIGKKRAMLHEIIDTVHILGLKNFDDYCRLNPVEITIDSNKFIKTLSNYKKYKFRFIIDSLLFSTNLQNNTDVIFITCDGLMEAKTVLLNSKLYKT